MILRILPPILMCLAFMIFMYFALKKQNERNAQNFAIISAVLFAALIIFAVWLLSGGGDMLMAQSWQQAICDLPSTDC